MEYIVRIKWGFSKYEYEHMTLRQYFALLAVETPEDTEKEIWADDLF